MDISTAAGILLGVAFLLIGILESGDIGTYIDRASIMITIGGTIAATLISFPLPKLVETLKSVKHVFFGKELNAAEAIEKIIELANTAWEGCRGRSGTSRRMRCTGGTTALNFIKE
jgi:chemotaxis protein MotA